MSRNQFRILVVLNQLLVLTWVVVQEMSDLSLPPELGSVRGSDASVMNPSSSGVASAGDIHYWFGNAILVIGLTASVGLFLGHRWGRTMFLFTWVATLFFSLAADIYVSTAWVGFFSYLASTTDGAILGLAYFSHVKRMFEKARED